MNVRTAAVIALAAAFLAGCSDPEPTPDPMTSTPATTLSPTTTASPSSTPLAPEEEATSAAEEVVRAYFETVPRCLADPLNTQPSCFDEVAIGTELNNSRNSLIAAKQVESTASGSVDVISMQPVSVDLTNDLDSTPPLVPVVIFDVCTDVSQFQVVDKEGNSLIPADRAPRARANIGVFNYEYPSPEQWRVGFIEQDKEASC